MTTWGDLPTMLHKEADTKPKFSEWDYAFIGYNTRKVKTYLDIADHIWTYWRNAEGGEAPFKNKYKKLALFGHSLGTLGIRQSLSAWSRQPVSMSSALHSITLFGTPVNGSPIAKLALGYSIRHALKPGNEQLRMLRVWSDSAHQKQPWPAIKLVLGQDDEVVGHEIADLIQFVGDGPHEITNYDHSELVKPSGWNTRAMDFIDAGL
ncbi:MAG: hypothetical protein RJQ07_01650 [Pseudomonadales bacterium]